MLLFKLKVKEKIASHFFVYYGLKSMILDNDNDLFLTGRSPCGMHLKQTTLKSFYFDDYPFEGKHVREKS